MNILFYDCFSGISGDMNLGAMLDLGIGEDYLRAELKKLNLDGWRLDVTNDQRHGIFGTKVTVVQTIHEHVHRHLSDINKIISESTLSEDIKEVALKIFTEVAEAEASVHRMPMEKVHFHEVGAIDSIVDIVGAAICFNKLEIDKVIVSNIELGGGFVQCAHGNLPVPAPATAEIVKDLPVSVGGVNFEATTPTGAAILKTLGDEFRNQTNFRILRTGYGIGQKENPDKPNILRVQLGESDNSDAGGHTSYMVECNIDDMNPELYENVITRLFEAGAVDVFLTPVIMKKNRPGTKVSIITHSGHIEKIKEVLFKESTTLGLRLFAFEKHTLERKFETVETTLGKVTVKYSYYKGELVSVKPENSDCLEIARKTKIPLQKVHRIVMQSIDGKENKK
ncbi:MAG: nickel pincer cofactor biosynthesis protein LarC [Bacteroidales bacterium]|nr:nickel pincer cofactor biosynthesis protein LarC [Bacteroidales bacterium]